MALYYSVRILADDGQKELKEANEFEDELKWKGPTSTIWSKLPVPIFFFCWLWTKKNHERQTERDIRMLCHIRGTDYRDNFFLSAAAECRPKANRILKQKHKPSVPANGAAIKWPSKNCNTQETRKWANGTENSNDFFHALSLSLSHSLSLVGVLALCRERAHLKITVCLFFSIRIFFYVVQNINKNANGLILLAAVIVLCPCSWFSSREGALLDEKFSSTPSIDTKYSNQIQPTYTNIQKSQRREKKKPLESANINTLNCLHERTHK